MENISLFQRTGMGTSGNWEHQLLWISSLCSRPWVRAEETAVYQMVPRAVQ